MRALLALAAAVVVLAGCGGGPAGPRASGPSGSNGTTGKPGPTKAVGPIAFSAKNLSAESTFLKTKFFWAGPQQGYRYEFTRTLRGYIYVRYLPPGVDVGAKGARFLIVATYPFPDAYAALKKQAKHKAIDGPGGSIIYVRPGDGRSVIMAFPDVDDQIEVYAPKPADALATAKSGKVQPVSS